MTTLTLWLSLHSTDLSWPRLTTAPLPFLPYHHGEFPHLALPSLSWSRHGCRCVLPTWEGQRLSL